MICTAIKYASPFVQIDTRSPTDIHEKPRRCRFQKPFTRPSKPLLFEFDRVHNDFNASKKLFSRSSAFHLRLN